MHRNTTVENYASAYNAACEFIRNNYMRRGPLFDDFIGSTLYSRRHIQRVLAHFGETWTGLVQRERMNAAKKLVLETDDPIYVIARKVGYNQPGAFTKQFAHFFGAQPRQIRSQHAAAA